MTSDSYPGTSTHDPSAACSSSLNTAPGSTVPGASASTFVSTTLPSTGALLFSAVTFAVWFGVVDVMANSTDSLVISYPTGGTISTKRYWPNSNPVTVISPLPSVVSCSEPATVAQVLSGCIFSNLNTAPGSVASGLPASTFFRTALPSFTSTPPEITVKCALPGAASDPLSP